MTNAIINNIKFRCVYSDNQENTFTPGHVRYRCTIKHNNKQYSFDYQCNPAYCKATLKDCLYSLISDASCYESAFDVDDFLNEFGYTDDLKKVREGEKVYKACKKTAAALHRLFTEYELESLNEYYQSY